MPSLLEWQNFYVIVGSAAGALTGLQFVVMALIADMPMSDDDAGAANAFSTPTIVHFVAVLLLAAGLVMPWHSLNPAAGIASVGGLAGLVYALSILRRMTRQTSYRPVLEDWVFHAWLPIAAYVALAGAPGLLLSHPRPALFILAAVALLLLCVAIHNAWDNVTYLVIMRRQRLNLNKEPSDPEIK